MKRIEAAKIRKQNAKLHSLQKDSKKSPEDDDGDSEDKLAQ